MINMNTVNLVGRLTKDVEVRKTQSGISTASFTVAIDRPKAKGAEKAEADFISCTAWRGTADFLGNYAKKGAVVSVEGRIQTRSYEKDGARVYVTEVLANNVQLMGGAGGTTPAAAKPATEAPAEEPVLDIGDDELPF